MSGCPKCREYHGGVVNSVSEYKKAWLRHTTGSETTKEDEADIIDKLLREYHAEGTTEERKLELKHDILMHVYFIFPHYLKKHYWFTKVIFNDAMQNMALNTLRAIEMYNPDLGFKFSNYLIGYFRDAAATALRSVYVVPVAALRQAAIDAALPEDSEDAASPYIVRGSNEPMDMESPDAPDTPEQPEDGTPDDSPSAGNEADTKLGDAPWNSGNLATADEGDDEENWFSPEEYDVMGNRQRVLRGAARIRGSVVELDDSRLYQLAPGTEQDEDVDENIHQRQLLEWLEEALSEDAELLTEEERFIVIHHFGLFNNPPMKYSEIAKIRKQNGTGYSCSRISQINTSAIRKLREFFMANEVEL